jgi:hypothetical protein
MLLVVDRREDLMPSPPEAGPRSTERALRHMGWPFPVDGNYTAPQPPARRIAQAQPTRPEPRQLPRRAPAPVAIPVPMFALELA